jgi:hypothetical protein
VGKITPPDPGNLIAGILVAGREYIDSARSVLEAQFGRTDDASEPVDFTFTDYYRPEMGANLLRFWVSFAALQPLARLAEIKLTTNKLENQFRDAQGNRRVNLDPGFLTMHNLVLATTKNYSHRIYLRDGIFAELTLVYEDGAFHPQRWTYPDYQSPLALEFLTRVRDRYIAKARGCP